ncbi:MAG TPA: O-antigen ligase family protein [Verrucomicrobiae bacterium]|nr:O-antigen ligase family protein [Verrucomicrobiae bacterium]
MNLHQSSPASAAIPLARQGPWSPTFRPARAPGRGITDSYLRLLTWTSIAYIVASQGLVYFSGWSRLGVLCAIFLAFLLAAGWICRLADFPHAGWVWLPLAFVVYALVRAIPEHGHPWPTDVLLKLPSAFLGGVGIGLALQAGVPFRALALAQTLIFLGNVVAVSAGIGSEAPAEVDAGRQSGLTGNANELAMQLTLGACLVWLAPKKSGRSLLLLAFAALIYGILTTGSRKSLIVAVCFLVLAAIQTRGFWRTRLSRVVLALAAPLVLFALLLAIPLLQESRHIVAVKRTLDYRDSSFNLRVAMARQAFRLWHDAPLVGWGTDSFRQISGFEKYAHSNYAELLCDLGVLGCCLFYALHVYILFKCLRLPRPWGVACALFVLMLAAVDTGLVSYTRKQTIMLLMILAAAVSTPNILLAPPRQALRRFSTARKF